MAPGAEHKQDLLGGTGEEEQRDEEQQQEEEQDDVQERRAAEGSNQAEALAGIPMEEVLQETSLVEAFLLHSPWEGRGRAELILSPSSDSFTSFVS